MTHSFALVSLIFYLLFLLGVLRGVFRQVGSVSARLQKLEYLGVLFQLLLIASLFLSSGVAANWGDLFLYLALALVVFDIFLRSKFSYPILTAALLTIAILLFLSSSILLHYETTVKINARLATYIFHVIPASISVLLQFLIFMTASAVLSLHWALKNKKATLLFIPTPGIAQFKSWLKKLLLWNFIFWTVTILSGGFYAFYRQTSIFSYDFVNLFSLLAWLLATLQLTMLIFGWKTVNYVKIALVVSLFIILVFVSKSFLISNSVHSFINL